MGIKIPNGSGGFKDIAALKRHNGSAWVDCEFARVYENGAWVDKWVNAKPFYIIQNNLNSSSAQSARFTRIIMNLLCPRELYPFYPAFYIVLFEAVFCIALPRFR